MLVFAYDGSLNGDWVAHYAVRFAAAMPVPRLRLLHVYDRECAPEFASRMARIADECALHGVELQPEVHALAGARVAERLSALVPQGPDTAMVVGTRSRPRERTFLAGTVSAELLAAERFSVIAIRAVHPGVLGQPQRVLLALTDEPRAARQAIPLLRLLGPDVRELQLLFLRELSRLHFRLLRPAALQRLLNARRGVIQQIEDDVRQALDPHRYLLDATAVVTDNLPRETLACAVRLRSRLICLGASAETPRRLQYGHPLEHILRDAPCDVAIYRTIE